ncbi:CMP-N-acetylneuraminic acid synthetase [Pasteurella testudinis DSM 23072]|uniref:CMP-N-acetylneuraminic acid synthetase n=2 Tax=Pasteurella testudinis TaxID=761 RepID=A0A1W1V9I0_9PAST|nr:CMP-N-acetylneuraminic acid synthetase [Pasteurella testudinis DSM 23072]SUB52107.1 N-acylneuraminate cytidylyltransferase [Pasteurella testudinis]
MAYTIEAAIKSKVFDKIVVSTDSEEYRDLISNYPIDIVIRDKSISGDSSSSFVVIKDVLERYSAEEFACFMLLQPTSPLRNSTHINQAIKLFEDKIDDFDFLVSVVESDKSSILIRPIADDGSLLHFDTDFANYTRQQYSEYSPNGAIFIAKPDSYLTKKHFFGDKSLAYVMDKKSSLDIDNRDDFEYLYFLLTLKNKRKNLDLAIQKRITEKKSSFNYFKDITLIGHSMFDQWDIEKLGKNSVNNLGISGINSQEYLDLIINKNILKVLGDKVLIFLGTNDIVLENWKIEDSIKWIDEIISKLIQINPNVKIYLLETLYTTFRADRENQVIKKLNDSLRNVFSNKVNFVELNHIMSDKYGKLNFDYTNDGLHLNSYGYQVLEKIIIEAIK